MGSRIRGLLYDQALLVIALPLCWILAFPRSMDKWSNSTDHEQGILLGGSGLKAHPPSSSLFPPFPSSFLMSPCKMVITTKSIEGDLARHSSTVMCVLVVFAGMYSQSFMGGDPADSISPVLLLFGVGTFVRLACRRWSEEQSATEDTPSPHPRPDLRRTKVSFPAAGINRAHTNASQGRPPPHVSLSS